MTNSPITILLVDDHKVLRDGLRALLESEPDKGPLHHVRFRLCSAAPEASYGVALTPRPQGLLKDEQHDHSRRKESP